MRVARRGRALEAEQLPRVERGPRVDVVREGGGVKAEAEQHAAWLVQFESALLSSQMAAIEGKTARASTDR